jgi:hypothetical protein
MSPVVVVIVLILTGLFIVLSILPLLPGQPNMESSTPVRRTKVKQAH